MKYKTFYLQEKANKLELQDRVEALEQENEQLRDEISRLKITLETIDLKTEDKHREYYKQGHDDAIKTITKTLKHMEPMQLTFMDRF